MSMIPSILSNAEGGLVGLPSLALGILLVSLLFVWKFHIPRNALHFTKLAFACRDQIMKGRLRKAQLSLNRLRKALARLALESDAKDMLEQIKELELSLKNAKARRSKRPLPTRLEDGIFNVQYKVKNIQVSEIPSGQYLAVLAAIAIIVGGGVLLTLQESITGYTVYEEKSQLLSLNTSFNSSDELTLDHITNITSLSLTGTILGEGSAKVYLEHNRTRTLVLELGTDPSEDIQVPSVPGPPVIKPDESENKKITAKLTYKEDSSYDTNNDGVTSTKDIIDLTVESTEFNWNVTEQNICTEWEVIDELSGESTLFCTGSSACCSLVDLAPTVEKIEREFYAIIKKGETKSISTQDDYIVGVRFNLKELRTGVTINIVRVLIPDRSEIFDTNVLGYYRIENNLQEDDYENAEIIYKIPFELLETLPDLGLYKFINNKWVLQKSQFIEEKNGHRYFKASPKSFSLFALATPPTQLSCRQIWKCTDWSECSEGARTRTCEDKNKCGTANSPIIIDSCDEHALLSFIEESRTRRSGLVGRAFGFGGGLSGSKGGILFIILVIVGVGWLWRRKHKKAKLETKKQSPQELKEWFEEHSKTVLHLVEKNNLEKASKIYVRMNNRYTKQDIQALPLSVKRNVYTMLKTAYNSIGKVESSSMLSKFSREAADVERYLEEGDYQDASHAERILESDADTFLRSRFLTDEQRARISYTTHTLKLKIHEHIDRVGKAMKNLSNMGKGKESPRTPTRKPEILPQKSTPIRTHQKQQKEDTVSNLSWWKNWGMDRIITKHQKVENNLEHIKRRADKVVESIEIMEKLSKKKEFRLAKKWYKNALAEYTILASSDYVPTATKNKLYKRLQKGHDTFNEETRR